MKWGRCYTLLPLVCGIKLGAWSSRAVERLAHGRPSAHVGSRSSLSSKWKQREGDFLHFCPLPLLTQDLRRETGVAWRREGESALFQGGWGGRERGCFSLMASLGTRHWLRLSEKLMPQGNRSVCHTAGYAQARPEHGTYVNSI